MPHQCEGKNTWNGIALQRKRQIHVLAQKWLHFPRLSSLTFTMVRVTMVDVTMVTMVIMITMVTIVEVTTVVVNMVVVTMVEFNMLEKLA